MKGKSWKRNQLWVQSIECSLYRLHDLEFEMDKKQTKRIYIWILVIAFRAAAFYSLFQSFLWNNEKQSSGFEFGNIQNELDLPVWTGKLVYAIEATVYKNYLHIQIIQYLDWGNLFSSLLKLLWKSQLFSHSGNVDCVIIRCW